MVIAVLLFGLVIGAVNGALVVVTRVPDIVVTLAMGFVWAGIALLVLHSTGRLHGTVAEGPGHRTLVIEWIPKAAVRCSSCRGHRLDPV